MGPEKNIKSYVSEKKTSETEIAIKTVRSLNGIFELVKAQGDEKKKHTAVEMAEDTLQKMQDPYAKKMILTKIEELKNIAGSQEGNK
jgi:hypothetical protein